MVAGKQTGTASVCNHHDIIACQRRLQSEGQRNIQILLPCRRPNGTRLFKNFIIIFVIRALIFGCRVSKCSLNADL